MQDLLHVIESETTEDGQTTPEPEVLGDGECANGGGGKNKRGEARDGHNGSTGEKRTADVKVLVLLGGSADDRDGAHHGSCIETGAGKKSRGSHDHQGSNESGLGGIEDGPEGILGNITGRRTVRNCQLHDRRLVVTYLSGSTERVAIIEPMLRAKPPMPTTQGLVCMSL